MDLIKELGLKIWRGSFTGKNGITGFTGDAVLVLDLRAALEKLPVVYGQKNIGGGMTYADNHQSPSDTHTARILGVENIVKEPLKVEFETVVTKDFGWVDAKPFLVNPILNKEFAGKRVRVLVTEIQEGE